MSLEHPAVTEAGPVVAEVFFKEEYILNNTIGEFLAPHSGISRCQVEIVANRPLTMSRPPGTYQKPYVALIDGITMGGVSVDVLLKTVLAPFSDITLLIIKYYYALSAR